MATEETSLPEYDNVLLDMYFLMFQGSRLHIQVQAVCMTDPGYESTIILSKSQKLLTQ